MLASRGTRVSPAPRQQPTQGPFGFSHQEDTRLLVGCFCTCMLTAGFLNA